MGHFLPLAARPLLSTHLNLSNDPGQPATRTHLCPKAKYQYAEIRKTKTLELALKYFHDACVPDLCTTYGNFLHLELIEGTCKWKSASHTTNYKLWEKACVTEIAYMTQNSVNHNVSLAWEDPVEGDLDPHFKPLKFSLCVCHLLFHWQEPTHSVPLPDLNFAAISCPSRVQSTLCSSHTGN